MFRMFVPTEAALYTRPNLYIRILIIQTNHVCYMNWEKNHLHLICEPSEYGWSDELAITILSTKEGYHDEVYEVCSF